MVEIKLLGELGRMFGRVWKLNIRSPKEAIKAISVNCPGFEQYIVDSTDKGIYWRVVIDDPLGIDESQLDYPIPKRLIVAPIVSGAGAVGKVLLGVALVGAAFIMPASISLFGLTVSSMSVGVLGAALIFSGIHKMMTPTPQKPKVDSRTNSDSPKVDSFLFDRAAELNDEGGSVPILYGEKIISDLILISSGIRVEQLALATIG